VPKSFPYERAAYTLAVGFYFSKQEACKVCHVKSSTYDQWVQRRKEDSHLEELFQDAFAKLAKEWVGQVTKTFNMQLSVLQTAMINHPFANPPESVREREAWAKCLAALSGAVKASGEMVIGGEVLHEEEIQKEKEKDIQRILREKNGQIKNK